MSRSKIKSWIEATRPRTLPVSVAGVIAGSGCAALYESFCWLPALICLCFAVGAQIGSNFANEYFDYKYGLDKPGREGFRRGVTEGDLSPKAMRRALIGVICATCCLGMTLLLWGGWWLLPVGIAIAIFALAYSTGPYPLSHHGLGDVAVIIFFGLVPVTLTCYVQTGVWNWQMASIPVGIATGLMAANVLIVNNYRDAEDDQLVGKHTTVVLFGRRVMAAVYLWFGLAAALLVVGCSLLIVGWWVFAPCSIYTILHLIIHRQLVRKRGRALNPLLGLTAANLLLFTLLLATIFFLSGYYILS